jgi:hypothetical protein
MMRSAEEDWPENQPVDPDTSGSDELLNGAQVEAQVRLIAGLRAIYADLLAEPVPDRLLELIREFEIKEKA